MGIAHELKTDGGLLAYLVDEQNPGEGEDARVEFRLELVPGGVELGWVIDPEAARVLGEHLIEAANTAQDGSS